MRAADELRILRPPWRNAVVGVAAAVLAVAALLLVLDGGRPAIAAGECQYGPYGPYNEPCEKARPSLATYSTWVPPIGGFQFVAVTLNEGVNPTGTLRFRLYGPDDPSCSSPVYESNVTVLGNRAYWSYEGPSSGSPQATSAGYWRWVVAYSGDAMNEGTSLDCGSNVVYIAKAEPLLTLSVGQGPVAVGSSFQASVTIQAGNQPSGTVALRLYGPGDASCSAPVDEEVFGVAGFGPYQASFSPTSAGTWRVVAAYSGDAANEARTTACDGATVEAVVPPPNDDFADATPVSGLPFADTVDPWGASMEPNEPWGCWIPSRTVWYAVTPTDDMRVTSSLSGGTLTMFVAQPSGGLSLFGCGTGTVGLERGFTYYFRVDATTPGSVTFGLDLQPHPNDEPANARPIGFQRFSDSDDSRYATSSPSDPSCFGRGDTVWYAFTPTEDMRLEAAAGPWYPDQQSHFTLSAYTKTGGTYQSLDCSDDSFVSNGIPRAHVEFDARAGETVYFMVGSSGGTTGGFYNFSLQRPLVATAKVNTKDGTASKDGVATLVGTMTCSRQVSLGLGVTLDQVFAGRQRANGFASVWGPCGPTGAPWSATVTSYPILFGAGRATVKLELQSPCDDQGCQPGALYDPDAYARVTTTDIGLRRG